VRRVLRGFGAPRYTAVAGRLAYVSDSATGEIAVIDLDAGRVLRRVAVGAGARHLALHPGGRTLWVALGSSAAQIAIVDLRDPERPRLAEHVRPPFLVHDVAFSPTGRRVWVTAGREPRLAVYAAGTRSLTRELKADDAPQHIAFGRAGAYVTSGEAGTLCVHALSDARLRRRSSIPRGSYNVEHAHERIVTPSLGTGALTVLDARGAVVARARAAAAAHDVCLVP
jgi:DNA-binding beta-propeller fold protein YncE